MKDQIQLIQVPKFEKDGNGYNIYINNELITWVIGSKNNAKKEAQQYIGKLKNK